MMYVDGMNLYEYVRSHPINGLDPYGLSAWDWIVGAYRWMDATRHFLYGNMEPWHVNSWANDIKKLGAYDVLLDSIKSGVLAKGAAAVTNLPCGGTTKKTLQRSGALSAWDNPAVAPLGTFLVNSKARCTFTRDCSNPKCLCKGVSVNCLVDYSVRDVYDYGAVSSSAFILMNIGSPIRMIVDGIRGLLGDVSEASVIRPFMINIDWAGSVSGASCPPGHISDFDAR